MSEVEADDVGDPVEEDLGELIEAFDLKIQGIGEGPLGQELLRFFFGELPLCAAGSRSGFLHHRLEPFGVADVGLLRCLVAFDHES
jgi:hypothetical protein